VGLNEDVDGEFSVVAGTSWRPRIAKAVFIRGRTVQCRDEFWSSWPWRRQPAAGRAQPGQGEQRASGSWQ